MKPEYKKLAVAIAAGLMTAVAGAQPEVSPGEAVPLPEAQEAGSGVSYVTGGIPYEQIPSFQQARQEYPLNVEVYEKAGARNEFTADAQVWLIEKDGDVVLDAKTEGPYLWAKVPPGQYKLETTLNGKSIQKNVSVGRSGATRAVVVFPQGTGD